jgi:aryl-alcohol dehydrogenase-like predicted oxidoreductase
MKYKLLGKTGLYVSELCLGTMTFGGKGFWEVIGRQGQETVDSIVNRSVDAGINFIDTANVYSYGESETLLGNAIKDKRGKLVIATKVHGRMGEGVNNVGLSRVQIMKQVHDSLKRLQTDYIDLYQIHGFDALTPLEETLSALNDLVRLGMVRYIGASNLAAWQLMKALGISDKNGWTRFESLQAYYTIAGRDLEREVAPLLKDQGVGLMVWSPLAGGLLSGKYDRNTAQAGGSRRDGYDFPPVNRDRAWNVVDVMREIATQHQTSVASVAIAWLLHQSVVTSVIIGAKTLVQLEDNLKAVNVKLSEDDLKRLNDVSTIPTEYPQWMIDMQSSGRSPAAK